MAVAQAIRRDWRAWDGLQPVTLAHMHAGKVLGPTESVQAKPRQLTTKEQAASNAAYQNGMRVWLVPDELVMGGALKPGDVVIDGSDRYTAIQADRPAFQSFWRLTTVNLAVAYDLGDTIDIQRAGVLYDPANGAPLFPFPSNGATSDTPGQPTTLYSGLLCRVQPQEAGVVIERGLRGQRVKFQVIVSQAVDVTTEDRIYWPAKDLYLDITGWHNAERVDELPVIDAELPP